MAVNETIVTGRKFRKLADEANKLWQKISFWGVANDVEFDDGENAEIKLGAINGITDSLTSTASDIAASANAIKVLNDKITQLNSDIISPDRLVFNFAFGGTFSAEIGKQYIMIAHTYYCNGNHLKLSGATANKVYSDTLYPDSRQVEYYALVTATSNTVGIPTLSDTYGRIYWREV